MTKTIASTDDTVADIVALSSRGNPSKNELISMRNLALSLLTNASINLSSEYKPVPHWEERARCKGSDIQNWYPSIASAGANSSTITQISVERIHKAKNAFETCAGCPVRFDCLMDALQNGEFTDGILGGLIPHDRKKLAKRLGVSSVSIGTRVANQIQNIIRERLVYDPEKNTSSYSNN